jgi:hypothetical protein
MKGFGRSKGSESISVRLNAAQDSSCSLWPMYEGLFTLILPNFNLGIYYRELYNRVMRAHLPIWRKRDWPEAILATSSEI